MGRPMNTFLEKDSPPSHQPTSMAHWRIHIRVRRCERWRRSFNEHPISRERDERAEHHEVAPRPTMLKAAVGIAHFSPNIRLMTRQIAPPVNISAANPNCTLRNIDTTREHRGERPGHRAQQNEPCSQRPRARRSAPATMMSVPMRPMMMASHCARVRPLLEYAAPQGGWPVAEC